MSMNDYRERFLSGFATIDGERRKIEEERKQKEIEQKKYKEAKAKEYAEKIFSENKKVLINNTLDNFLLKMEKSILPPYEVSTTLEIGIDELACSILQNLIEEALKEELPPNNNIKLKVSVKDKSISHGHEEGNNYAGRWVHDYTEYKLVISISLDF